MIDNRYTASPSQLGVRPAAELANRFLTQAFGWMFAGLLLTAGVAFIVQGSDTLLRFAAQWFWILFIAQLGLVIAISAGINRVNATATDAPVYAVTINPIVRPRLAA
jgi:FtsH-binding integral membrane protein